MALVKLTKIRLELARSGTGGTFRAKLYAADEDGFPTGGVLASDSVAVSSLPEFDTFGAFDFSLGHYLVIGERYCVVLQADGVVYDNTVLVATPSTPQGVTFIASIDGGSSWSDFPPGTGIFIKVWLDWSDAAPYGLGDADDVSGAVTGLGMYEDGPGDPPSDTSFIGVNFTAIGDVPPSAPDKAITPAPVDEATGQFPNSTGLSWEEG